MDLPAALAAVDLAELCSADHVPGAVLGVWHDGAVATTACGVVNQRTSLATTTDTVFQVGSITKVWTASLIMMLVEEGLVALDEPVRTYLPNFRLAEPAASERITVRHLLTHTSGIAGDHFFNTGRGSDCLERYVESCAELALEHEVGATMSYCNTGYSLLGRIIEVASGHHWDTELRRRLLRPLGLTATGTLAEEAILHSAAVGHLGTADRADGAGSEPAVAPAWHFARSSAPAGMLHAPAEELLAFAALHINGGVVDGGGTTAGTRLLSEASVAAMQEPQVAVPDRWSLGTHWGLGWILHRRDAPGYGHDGATLGQYAFLRVLPEQRTAVCLLTNGGSARHVWHQVFAQLAQSVAGVAVDPRPSAPATAPALDTAAYTGHYERLHVHAEVQVDEAGALQVRIRHSGPLAQADAPGANDITASLTAVDDALFLAAMPGAPEPLPLVFFDFDGARPQRFHFGGRAHTRAA